MNLYIWLCIIVPASLFAHIFFPASLFAHVFLNLPTIHTYSTYILYVLCWLFPPLYLLMFFISTYCTYLFYVHTVSALLIVPASLFAHVFLYLPTVLCRNVFSFWELFPTTTKKLTFLPLYLFMFFLHLPTVHTFSTYILYILCWPSCLFILLMFFLYLPTVHT